MKSLIPILTLLFAPLISNKEEKRFTMYYEIGTWGKNEKGEGYSGEGALVRYNTVYMKFLQNFVKKHKIKTIVDLGCGDWTFSQHINWNGAKYTGIDIVKPVIEKNTQKFGTSKVKFIHSDGRSYNLPKADLLICKDVLQHLTDPDIEKVLTQLPKFKHCLITNDVNPLTRTSENKIEGDDLIFGRLLDITKAPFNIKGCKALHYKSGPDLKLVLHVKN